MAQYPGTLGATIMYPKPSSLLGGWFTRRQPKACAKLYKSYTMFFCHSSRRLSGKNHTVEDGWFTVALSRVYPKPSPLPDLHLVTEAIAWDDSWANMANKVQKTLRYLVQLVFLRPRAPIIA